MSELIVAGLVLVGGLFGALGALGLIRLPDVLIRMHASTKTGTLACGLIIVAAAVFFGSPEITIRAIAIILFLLLTAPIAAHMIGRAAFSTGVPLYKSKLPTPKTDAAEQTLADLSPE